MGIQFARPRRSLVAAQAASSRCALVLGDGRQDVHRQLVRVRVIDGDEFHTRIHERRYKGEVAGQSIELGNDELSFLFLAGRERFFQFRPVIPLAALNFGELGPRPSSPRST
jgi:hypothetical protein